MRASLAGGLGDTGRAMSEENVALERRPPEVREHSRRTLDQRLALRFPPLAAASRSSLRQTAAELAHSASAAVAHRPAQCRGVQPAGFQRALAQLPPTSRVSRPPPPGRVGHPPDQLSRVRRLRRVLPGVAQRMGDYRMRPSEVIDPRRPSRDRRRDRRSRRDQRRTGDRSTLRCRVHAARGPARFRLRRGVWGPEGRCGIVLLGAAVRRV